MLYIYIVEIGTRAMTITAKTLKAYGIIDNGCKEYFKDPICPKIEQATGIIVHCDDPFCHSHKRCAFKDHPRGRAKWIEMELNLGNWSA